uniref:Uncharacterized protein n=1 Tax=Podoviridae sp. ctz6O13 TaxID=2827757 RepID=A0A8S5TKC1_9CAUD|nr:MAG TPA: hypothetical protein [Podoviridae sp. ctz6O13]
MESEKSSVEMQDRCEGNWLCKQLTALYSFIGKMKVKLADIYFRLGMIVLTYKRYRKEFGILESLYRTLGFIVGKPV